MAPEVAGELAKPDTRLEEAQIFIPPFEFTNTLREANDGKQGPDFWSDWVTERYQQLQEQTGAESPQAAASRVDAAIDDVAAYGQQYAQDHPGRKLAVFMISHSEMLEALAHHKLGRPGTEIAYNDAFEINVSADGHIDVKEEPDRAN
jgi:broad specificity phosphatase PhoE